MKSMKWLGIVLVGIPLILFLAACQPTPPSPTPEPQQAEPTTLSADPTATATALPAAEAYPAPDMVTSPAATEEGYPPPPTTSTGQTTPPSGIGSAYPEPEEVIPWEQARSIILGGQVKQVFQLHSQKVILVLEDDQIVETYEPALDDVFAVIDECGEACSNIVVATE
jgi:hypothetical protein